MTFLEAPRLDSKITHGAVSSVRWNRQKTYTASGKLTQDFRWANPKHEMDLSHGLRNAADYQVLLDFHYIVFSGGFEGFRVKDWRDYIATQQNTAMTATVGATGDYQLQRKHVAGANQYLRDIKKPVVGTVVVWRNRAGAITTASATVDYTNGRVIVAAHIAGDTYTWTGEFDVPMTFVDDVWTGHLEVNTENLHVDSQSVQLEEIRL